MKRDPKTARLPLDLAPPANRYSIEEAVELIEKIYTRIQSVEDFRLKLKWCLGHVVVHLEAPVRRRRATIETLADRLWKDRALKIAAPTLYECAAVYRSFEKSLAKFEAWIEDKKLLYQRPIYWADVQKEVLGGRSNSRVIGRKAANQRDLRAVEDGTEALDKLLEREAEGTADEGEEIRGAIEGFRQSVEALANLPDVQPRIPRSEEYLSFVRLYGCAVCSRPADAHHAVGRHGIGQKPSDYGCAPLCRKHHSILHHIGDARFCDRYDVDLLETAYNLFHRYVTGCWLTRTLARATTPPSSHVEMLDAPRPSRPRPASPP